MNRELFKATFGIIPSCLEQWHVTVSGIIQIHLVYQNIIRVNYAVKYDTKPMSC